MKNLKAYLLIFSVQAIVILFLLELGFRIWLNYTEENSATFENQVLSIEQASTTKISGKVTLGRLIKKSSNPDRVYEFMPNIEATYLGQPFRTNSYGIREKEYPKKKPENTKRIIGIGDSVMFGWGVKEEGRYLNLIQTQLAEASSSKYETLNFGTPGYNTTMEVATYESLASQFDPDLIVLHFVENDFGVPEFMNLPIDLYSLRKSFVLEAILKYVSQLTKKQNQKKDLVGVEFPGFDRNSKNQVIQQYQHMLGNVGFSRALKKLRKLACAKKVPVIILTGKLRSQFESALVKHSMAFGFQIVEAAPTVNAYFRRIGIENDPIKRKAMLWLNENDPHPNQLGHKLYAEALYPVIFEVLNAESGKFEPKCRS